MYTIKGYQKGFEEDQVRIGIEVSKDWVWPYAYDLVGLLRIHAQPDFDPDTRHYCFLGEEMVGTIFSIISSPQEGEVLQAAWDFPRVIPGHEPAAELLVERALEVLKSKGVSRVVGRVTTMAPADIQLAEKMGFNIHDWGYKVYYSYEMGWGKLDFSGKLAEEIDPEKDLDACAELATNWYGRPKDFCKALLTEWHEEGVITHVGVRDEKGKWIASCMAAPNEVRPSTAANYYIYTPDAKYLKPLLAKVIEKCIDYGVQNIISDLINEHRQYEPVYQELGFKKVAEWARCEMEIQ